MLFILRQAYGKTFFELKKFYEQLVKTILA